MKIKPFVNLVLLMSEKENKIEIIRQILCEIPDFEPYTIFKQLDKKQQNFIDSEDISDFLNQNREIYSKKTVESTLMDHFAPLEGKITYKIFLKMVLPQENSLLRKAIAQKEIKKPSEESFYTEEIVYTLSKIIKEEILTYLDSEELKFRIGEQKSYELFRSIDKSNLGFIDFDNLSYFIQNNQYNIEAESLAKFLKRISRNEELRLPKREFCNFLMLPGYYKSSNHTPLRNIDEKSIGIIKENTSKNIENYEKTQSNIQGNFCNPHQISLNKGKYYDQNENPLENNTLRLETADFQYSDNADDQKSLASIYESPIYKQHCYSKNKDIPLAYLDSQESLLELKNELINTNLKINNDSKNINNYIENKENEVSRTKNRYGGFKKNGFALKERNLNEENTHSLNKNWSNDENNEKLMIFRKKSEEDEFSDRNLNFYTFNKHKSFKEEKFKDFFDYFEEILRLEKKTEKLKQDLALRPDFNLLDFFVIFDKNQKGYLTFEEIVIMFSDLKIKVSEEEIKLFLKKFDKSNFGKLKFSDFLETVTPLHSDYADLMKQRKPINMDLEFTLYQMFSNETLKLIFIVLQEHCKDETVLEGLRNKNYGKNTNIQDFFKKMDRDNDGFITLLDIKEILNESHKNLKEKDICQLFNRFDIKKKGKFGLSEFLNELSSTN